MTRRWGARRRWFSCAHYIHTRCGRRASSPRKTRSPAPSWPIWRGRPATHRFTRAPAPNAAGGPHGAVAGLPAGRKYFSRNPGSRLPRFVTTAAPSRKISATARFRLLRNARLFPCYIFPRVCALPRTPMTLPKARCGQRAPPRIKQAPIVPLTSPRRFRGACCQGCRWLFGPLVPGVERLDPKPLG